MSREAHEARKIQQALLPRSSPYIPGFVISGLSTPAGAVGGDWYDFIPFSDGRWGLVLADVSGKGMAAALLMSATRGILRSLAEASCSPSEVLTKLNQLLVNDFPSGRFVTMVYAVLDPVTRTLTFASAGHLRPLLIENSNARFLDTERGLPLGIGPGDYSEAQLHFLKARVCCSIATALPKRQIQQRMSTARSGWKNTLAGTTLLRKASSMTCASSPMELVYTMTRR